MSGSIAGLLLCGGQARRFGGDKLLAGDPPIVVRAARAVHAALGHVLAVVPLGRASLRQALEAAGCEVLETDRTARGIGASLAAGVEATSRLQGWIVALGDMPSIAPPTFEAIAAALRDGAQIAAPFDAAGRRGHPVGFAASLRGELLALDGDIGARDLLARHAQRVHRIVVRDPGIFVDIDTPDDLARLG